MPINSNLPVPGVTADRAAGDQSARDTNARFGARRFSSPSSLFEMLSEEDREIIAGYRERPDHEAPEKDELERLLAQPYHSGRFFDLRRVIGTIEDEAEKEQLAALSVMRDLGIEKVRKEAEAKRAAEARAAQRQLAAAKWAAEREARQKRKYLADLFALADVGCSGAQEHVHLHAPFKDAEFNSHNRDEVHAAIIKRLTSGNTDEAFHVVDLIARHNVDPATSAAAINRISDRTDIAKAVLNTRLKQARQESTSGPLPGSSSSYDNAWAAIVEEYNAQHAIVRLGSKARIAVRGTEGEPFDFMQEHDFELWKRSDKRLIKYTDKNGRPAEAKIYPAAQWLDDDHRRVYDRVAFKPYPYASTRNEPPVPSDTLNLFTGWPVKPERGDWSLLRRHMYENLCHRDPFYFAWLLSWCADLVKDPAHKKGTAIVTRSKSRGTGKSSVPKFLGKLFPANYASIADQEGALGKFNGSLEQALLVTLEEGFWSGNKQAESMLKTIISEERLRIERKRLDGVMMDNFARVWVCSNEDWTVPVGQDERRFLVLDVSEAHANDASYFRPLYRQMEEEGGLQALFFDLLHLRIPDFVNLRHAPATPGLLKQAEHSAPLTHRWWSEVLAEGAIFVPAEGPPAFTGTKPTPINLEDMTTVSIECSDAYSAFNAFCRRSSSGRYLPARNTFGTFMAQIGATRTRSQTH